MPAKQKQEKKQQPKLLDERLVAAFAHETRAHALGVFAVRPASTKELAEELDQSVSAVWYHVDKLLRLGCIEPVESRRRRGAREHFFKATVPHFFEDEVWEQIPKEKRIPIVTGVLRLIAGDLNEAVRADTVDTVDNHLSRSLLNLDGQGWDESRALLNKTLKKLLAIREKATMRMAETGEKPVRTSVSIMHFQLPPRGPAV